MILSLFSDLPQPLPRQIKATVRRGAGIINLVFAPVVVSPDILPLQQQDTGKRITGDTLFL